MGGDRVLVLEDGQRTGDLYSTAPDHAVFIDPLTAQQMEVVRGPAACCTAATRWAASST
jgi:iron complex outermembrane recepter protein